MRARKRGVKRELLRLRVKKEQEMNIMKNRKEKIIKKKDVKKISRNRR